MDGLVMQPKNKVQAELAAASKYTAAVISKSEFIMQNQEHINL